MTQQGDGTVPSPVSVHGPPCPPLVPGPRCTVPEDSGTASLGTADRSRQWSGALPRHPASPFPGTSLPLCLLPVPVKGGFGSCRPPGPRGESRVFNRDGDWSVQLVSEPPDRWGLHAGSAVLGARAAPCPPPWPLPGGSPSPWAAAPHAFLTPLCQGVVPGRVGAAPVLTRRQAAHPAKGTDQVRSPELPDGGPGVPG